MGFTTFQYEKLIDNMLRLREIYATHLGRYAIDLAKLIEQVNEHVSQCATERLTQRQVFPQLVTELRRYNEEGSPEEKTNATLFLLGALIHRYLRIKDEYKAYNESYFNPLSYFKKTLRDVNACGLFTAITQALQLNKKTLDELTVVTALDVFRKNMLIDVEVTERNSQDKMERQVKKTRYLTYPHFRDDPNFRTHLDALIEVHGGLAANALRHFKAISFMESLAVELDKETQPIEIEMEEWCKALAKKHKHFASLNQELAEAHLSDYFHSKPEIKIIILDLISFCYTRKKFEGVTDYATFKEKLSFNNTNANRTRICGAYLLLLKSGGLDKDLTTLIRQSLGLELEELTDIEQLGCIDNFKSYIEESNPKLNYEFFNDGKLSALTELSQISVSLNTKTRERAASSAGLSA